jgi:RNA polymerase sigma-70 factor (ECF subfamily)
LTGIANQRPAACVITGVTGAAEELDDWVRGRYARAYRSAVMICGNPADAEEAVQDAFLRVWRFRDSLPADDRRNAWLYRVLVNSCYSKLRQEVPRRDRERARLAAGPDTPGPQIPEPSETPEHAAERSLLAQALDSTLRELPEPLRVVVVLRYYADLSEREIATAIRRRPGTVKSRLHEARRRLAADSRLAGFADDSDAEVTTR